MHPRLEFAKSCWHFTEVGSPVRFPVLLLAQVKREWKLLRGPANMGLLGFLGNTEKWGRRKGYFILKHFFPKLSLFGAHLSFLIKVQYDS